LATTLRQLGNTIGHAILDFRLSLLVSDVCEDLGWLDVSRLDVGRVDSCRCHVSAARNDRSDGRCRRLLGVCGIRRMSPKPYAVAPTEELVFIRLSPAYAKEVSRIAASRDLEGGPGCPVRSAPLRRL
jgi:hypothetical protein